MVLAPNDLFSWNNKYNKYNNYILTDTFTCYFLSYVHQLTLSSWHHETMRGSSSLASYRLLTSSLFLCLDSTDASCSRLGGSSPPFPNMAAPFSGSAHTPLPGSGTICSYRHAEQRAPRHVELGQDTLCIHVDRHTEHTLQGAQNTHPKPQNMHLWTHSSSTLRSTEHRHTRHSINLCAPKLKILDNLVLFWFVHEACLYYYACTY
jgi:hypothetical protein